MGFTKATFDYLDSGGLINWQLTAKTAAFTAVSGEGYLVDTTSAAITVTLPAAPSAGDEIIIVDYASNAGTNNITLDPGTLNLRGATTDLVLDNDNQTARLLYSGATKGWLVTTEAGAGAAAATPDLTVDYLVVAGGGGGATRHPGGGGAGGLRTSYTNTSSLNGHTETALSLNTSTNYTVTIGAGGTSVSGANVNGNSGENSTFSDITSTGGGGGSTYITNGLSGGSGGGGGEGSPTSGGAAVTSPVTQGYAGGRQISGAFGNYLGGGGGGGANGIGGDDAGNGGAGLSVNILNTTNATTESVGEVSGSDVYFAGGGGGAGYLAGGSTGGIGGGGDGKLESSSVPNATPNTGGGGGANATGTSTPYTSGAGGSGIVILRYPDAYTITETTSPSVLTFNTYTEGSDKVTVFTSGDTGTIQFST